MTPCPLCRGAATPLGAKPSRLKKRLYHYFACPLCGLYFIGDPWLDFKRIYNLDYYRGRSGDGSVDYVYELEHPNDTVRVHEYEGLLKAARHALGRDKFRWLDYGCGNGGLIPYVKARSGIKIEGFEEGAIAALARKKGIPLLNRRQLKGRPKYDLVSAIEVIEHHPDPLAMLLEIKSLLKPGGILILSTGNAAPHAKRLLGWSYASAPDVHIRFFSPQSLKRAYLKAGLKIKEPGYAPGSTEIIRYKILKGLGFKRDSAWFRLLPWPLLSRLADHFHQVTAQPWATLARPEPRKPRAGL